ncbi:MAG: transglutaminase-like domain-containing protein [bacterium]|nr:transglutaminase-like domain-containing protein [bacterium]MDT8396625.1 transglutaminase-like domain-containing protein [bacterium]
MDWWKKSFIIVLGVGVIYCAGFVMGEKTASRCLRFENIRTNHTVDYSRLICPYSEPVKILAARLKSPEEAFSFVRDEIRFEPYRPVESATHVLREQAASCLGKAALLCSLYRAMGVPSSSVYVVTGQVAAGEEKVEHAWVNLAHDGKLYQQDPSQLLGTFDFHDFPGQKYSQSFVHRELFCFNDDGFAVVSQLNRMSATVRRDD